MKEMKLRKKNKKEKKEKVLFIFVKMQLHLWALKLSAKLQKITTHKITPSHLIYFIEMEEATKPDEKTNCSKDKDEKNIPVGR